MTAFIAGTSFDKIKVTAKVFNSKFRLLKMMFRVFFQNLRHFLYNSWILNEKKNRLTINR